MAQTCWLFGDLPWTAENRKVDEKIRRVSRPIGVSARAVLVYDGELAPTIETDGYFDAVVQFAKLLGL